MNNFEVMKKAHDEENREKCLEIVKLVLCMEENDD